MSKVKKRTTGERAFDTFNVLFLIGLMLVTFYPLLYVLFASLSDPALFVRHTGFLLAPLGLNFGSYKMVFQNPLLLTSYMNTIFYVVTGTAISLFLTILGAYAFSRKTMWGTALMMIVVFTMWFNGGMIPYYLLVKDLGMLNSRWALLIPKAISTFNLIIMRTSFQQVPVSLEESARIDGARDMTILFRIILPLSMPVIAVITLFYAVSQWNAWFDAMLFINNTTLQPLQILLRQIIILSSTDSMTAAAGAAGVSDSAVTFGETIKYATVIVATVPVLCIYPFLQRYFVKGVMVGAIKG